VEEVVIFQRMRQQRGESVAGAAAVHCDRRSSTGLRAARWERD
jgi:hypothetical protein